MSFAFSPHISSFFPKLFLTLVIFDLLLVGLLLYGIPLEAHSKLIYGLSSSLHYMKAVTCHSGVGKTKTGDCTHAFGQIHRDACNFLPVDQRNLVEGLSYTLGLSSLYHGYYRSFPSMCILVMDNGPYVAIYACLINTQTGAYVCRIQHIIFRMLLLVP